MSLPKAAAGHIDEVEVTMGVGAYEPGAVPFFAEAPLIDGPFEVDGVVLHLTTLSIGNPHAVTFDVLDEAAIAALRRCRFRPGTRGGEPVAVRIALFKIRFYRDQD